MFIKEAHILIEQGLQNIGVFAHSEVDPQEIDLEIKTWIWKTMDQDFPSEERGKLTKPKLDKYLVLIEKEIEFPVTLNARGDYEATLPDNYFHLIKVDALVSFKCGEANVESGKIEDGFTYLNLGPSIIYNGITIPIRKTFKGVNVPIFSNTSTAKSHVVKLKTIVGATRVIEEEFSTRIKNNPLTRSKPKSAIVTLSDRKIIISVDDFFVEKVYISYLKKPQSPNIMFKKFIAGVNLEPLKEYEVIKGSVIYNGTTYTAGTGFVFPTFTQVGANYTITGTGTARIKGDGDINLPYQVALNIIDKVVLKLSINSEQSPQKIQGLASTI